MEAGVGGSVETPRHGPSPGARRLVAFGLGIWLAHGCAGIGYEPGGARGRCAHAVLGRAAARRSSVAMVDWSMRPSTLAGRKWRWNALTTNSVVPSTKPVGSIP